MMSNASLQSKCLVQNIWNYDFSMKFPNYCLLVKPQYTCLQHNNDVVSELKLTLPLREGLALCSFYRQKMGSTNGGTRNSEKQRKHLLLKEHTLFIGIKKMKSKLE